MRAEEHAKVNCWLLFLLMIVAATYVFWDIGRPFNQTDEFLYAGVTAEMLQSGDYVTPRFGPIQLLTKPPLFYWMSAPALALVGDAHVAMRIIPGLSFLLILVLVYRITRKFWTPPVGLAAATVFFLCYDHLFNHVYRSGVMEGLLNLLMAVVLWLNLQLRESPERLRWIAVVLALALLTKSAFVVIPASINIANLCMNRGAYAITRRLVIQSLALFAVVALPWFLLVLFAHGKYVLEYMFVDQVWKRAINDHQAALATGRSFGRSENFYVLRHFLEYGQPWSLLVWPALWSATRSKRHDSLGKSTLLRICVGWVVGVLLLFLVVRGRWSWYISSIYIPASILIAAMFWEFYRDAEDEIAKWVWAGVGAAFLVARSPFLFNPYETSSGGFPLYGNPWVQLAAFLVVAAAVVALQRRGKDVASVRVAQRRGALVFTLAVVATVILVYATLWESPYSITLVAAPVAGVVCLSMLVLIAVRRHQVARAVCLACPFVLAAGYLAAPLHWSGDDNRRWEIKWVEREIAAGHFQRDQTLELKPLSLFSFIPIYASFDEDFDVVYDADEATVTLVPRRRALKSE